MTRINNDRFVAELDAAGVIDRRFSWWPDGTIEFHPDVPQSERDKVLAVLAAHDPTKPYVTIEDVDAERDRRLADGYVDAVTGKTYQCRARDVAIWTAIAASAALNVLRGEPYSATTYDLITADNTTITLSAAEASALFEQRVMPWVSATYLYARALKDQILAGETPDITQGWP